MACEAQTGLHPLSGWRWHSRTRNARDLPKHWRPDQSQFEHLVEHRVQHEELDWGHRQYSCKFGEYSRVWILSTPATIWPAVRIKNPKN
jgi:hypothetical protein